MSAGGTRSKETFKYNGGIVDYVRHLNNTKESLFRKVGYLEQTEEHQEVEIAFQWNTGYYESIYSFANGISTTEGGMHEEGLRKALTNVVNRYARKRNLLKEKEDNFKGEDIREGLTAILSVRSSATPSSKVRPRASSATSPCARWLSVRPTRSSPNGWTRTRAKAARSPPRRSRRHAPAWQPRRSRPHPPQERTRWRRSSRQAGRLLIQ